MKTCTCKSQKCLRALSVLRSCQLCSVVDTESNIWIGRSTTNLASLDATCAMNNDFDDANRRIYWSPGKKLFKIERKYVRLVHHGAENRVDHFTNERRQAGDLGASIFEYQDEKYIVARVRSSCQSRRCHLL